MREKKNLTKPSIREANWKREVIKLASAPTGAAYILSVIVIYSLINSFERQRKTCGAKCTLPTEQRCSTLFSSIWRGRQLVYYHAKIAHTQSAMTQTMNIHWWRLLSPVTLVQPDTVRSACRYCRMGPLEMISSLKVFLWSGELKRWDSFSFFFYLDALRLQWEGATTSSESQGRKQRSLRQVLQFCGTADYRESVLQWQELPSPRSQYTHVHTHIHTHTSARAGYWISLS